MFKVLPLQAVRIGKDRLSLFKRDAMLLSIRRGFPAIPREHITVYTLNAPAISTSEKDGKAGWVESSSFGLMMDSEQVTGSNSGRKHVKLARKPVVSRFGFVAASLLRQMAA